jgi:hypothetical protein
MAELLTYSPVAAAVLAVPQFVPQIRRLRATGDATGVSWSWAALTGVNNAAWTAYFALARYWTALIPSVSVAVLAGLLALMLTRGTRADARPLRLIAAWTALLVIACVIGGGAGLGTLLTAGFMVQVTPPLWTAYRVARPTGVSAGTWLLIFGELGCWLMFGVQESDPRLIVLGSAGVIASALMLARIGYTARGPRRRFTWMRRATAGRLRSGLPGIPGALPAGSALARSRRPLPASRPQHAHSCRDPILGGPGHLVDLSRNGERLSVVTDRIECNLDQMHNYWEVIENVFDHGACSPFHCF